MKIHTTGPEVTILVPNFRTPELTKICLRLLRKYTNPNVAKVVVIDNDSQDESTRYLRELNWIELIERPTVPGESPVLSHSHALDLALSRVTTPYVLSIHTDTLVYHPEWLTFLLDQIKQNKNIAGVGSWKLESKPFWKRALKSIERFFQLTYYRITGKSQHMIEGVGQNFYYLRSHCALYRTDLLNLYGLTFSQDNDVAGKAIHKNLVEKNHEMLFLPSHKLLKYMDHINHGTTILNPAFTRHSRSLTRGMSRIRDSYAAIRAEEILQDDSLDD